MGPILPFVIGWVPDQKEPLPQKIHNSADADCSACCLVLGDSDCCTGACDGCASCGDGCCTTLGDSLDCCSVIPATGSDTIIPAISSSMPAIQTQPMAPTMVIPVLYPTGRPALSNDMGRDRSSDACCYTCYNCRCDKWSWPSKRAVLTWLFAFAVIAAVSSRDYFVYSGRQRGERIPSNATFSLFNPSGEGLTLHLAPCFCC